MNFPPSANLIYHPILAAQQQQQQQNNVHQPHQQQTIMMNHMPLQQLLQHKPIHVKVLVFETKQQDLSSEERMEKLKPISIRRGEVSLPNYAALTTYLTEKCGLTLENSKIRYQDDESHWIDISSDEELAYGIQLCKECRTSANRTIFRIAVLLLKKEEPVAVPKQPQQQPERCCRGRRFFRHHQQQQLPENHPRCPFMFRKTDNGDNVLEVDVDVDKLKGGLDVGKLVKDNIDNVQIPHFGVTCDGCGKYAFVGKRFKCDDCNDFDYCQDCFANDAVRDAHFGGSHSFQEKESRSARFLKNIFCSEKVEEKKPEEEIVIDNQLYEEAEPIAVVEEPVPVVVEEPVVLPVIQHIPVCDVPHPLNPVQQPIIVVPEPVVVVEQPPQQPSIYQHELILLRDMGFVDEFSNMQLLKKYNGDLQRVIVDLIH